MPESFTIILIVLSFSWTIVALDEYILRYYDSEILVINASINGTISSIVSRGAYSTVGTSCNMVDCSVKSFRNHCNHFPLGLVASCYLVDCNNEELNSEIMRSGSATMDRQCPRGSGASDGLVIPARNIKQMIKRLSIITDHKDVFSFPVIVVHYKDAFFLSAQSQAGVMFSVNMGDERLVSYSVTPADRSNHSGPSRSIPKGPFYYATLFLIFALFSVVILVIISAAGIGITWMCRKCTIKKYIKSYVKVMADSEQGDDNGTNHCCICLEDYKPNDIIGVLPCEHEYHKSCINKWFTKHSTCPLCKSDIMMAKRHEIPPFVIGRETLSSPAAASSPTEVTEINFEVTEL